MSRLINADALKKDLTRFYDGEVVARKLIDEQPTVDAVPVKHGRWIKSGRDYDCIVCSECGTRCGTEPFGYGHYLSDFCPSCGADMRKECEKDG